MEIKTNHKIISPIQHGLEIEIPGAEFGKYITKAVKWFRSNIIIDGFRKGKAPDAAVRAQVGEKRIKERAAEMLAADAFDQAGKDLEKKPITPPEFDIEDVNDGEPIKFKVTYYIEPPTPDGLAKEIRDKHYPEIIMPEDIFPEGPPNIQSTGPNPLSPETLRNLPGLNLGDKFIPNPLPNIPSPQKAVPVADPAKLEIPDPEKLTKPPDVLPRLPKRLQDLKEEMKRKDKQKELGSKLPAAENAVKPNTSE
jgi:hypothetical protein